MLRAVDDHRRGAVQDDEHLLVVALALVVLGEAFAGLEVDDVHPERAESERATGEAPLARALEIAAVDDVEAALHCRAKAILQWLDGPAVPPGRGRGALAARLGGGGSLQRRPRSRARKLRHRASPAERHGRAAHGPRPPTS